MTARQPGAAAQFTAILSRFPPETVSLVKGCMPKLRRALPGTTQMVYDYGRSLVVSFSHTGRGYEAPVAIAVHPGRVQLYFPKDVPDPEGRLAGAGTKVRSVTLESASEIDRGAVHDLIRAAVRHAGGPFPGSRSTGMVIQSQSKKKPTRKTARA